MSPILSSVQHSFMNYPSFLSESQIEELEVFGMIELTEELCGEILRDSDETPFYIDDLYDDGEALASAGYGTDEDYGFYGDEGVF